MRRCDLVCWQTRNLGEQSNDIMITHIVDSIRIHNILHLALVPWLASSGCS